MRYKKKHNSSRFEIDHTNLQMRVWSYFLEKSRVDNAIQSRVSILDVPKDEKKPNFDWLLCDYLALKYIKKHVFVWKGHFKNKIGTVSSISGNFARLSFEGATAGRGVQTLRRELLIR